MREKLRDPIWQFVGIIVGMAVAFLIFWLQQSRKELSYEIVSQTPLVSVQDEARSRLQISFDGKPVEDVTLIVLRLQNSGNVPITPADYIRPVTFNFGQSAAILSAEVTESVPSNIGASIKTVSDTVELAPVLMNGDDSMTLKVLLTRGDGTVSADARIVGVNQLLVRKTSTSSLAFYIISFFILFYSMTLFWCFSRIWGKNKSSKRSTRILYFLLFLISIYIIISSITRIFPIAMSWVR